MCPVDPLGAGGFTRVTCGFIFLLPDMSFTSTRCPTLKCFAKQHRNGIRVYVAVAFSFFIRIMKKSQMTLYNSTVLQSIKKKAWK